MLLLSSTYFIPIPFFWMACARNGFNIINLNGFLKIKNLVGVP